MSDLQIAPVVEGGGDSAAAATREPPQLLVLVLDANPGQPLFARRPESLLHLLDCALALLNAHLMLGAGNAAAAVAAHAQGCSFLYPESGATGEEEEARAGSSPDGQFEGFHELETKVRAALKRIIR